MSGTSSVGNSGVYEAGDQRTEPDTKKGGSQGERGTFGEEGVKNSHQAHDSSMSVSFQYFLSFIWLSQLLPQFMAVQAFLVAWLGRGEARILGDTR